VSFRPFRARDDWHGLLAVLGLLGLDLLLLRFVAGRSIDGLTYGLGLWVLASLLAIVYLGHRTVGAFTMHYRVDRDAVTLIWGPTRQVIPLGQIQRVQFGLGERRHQPSRPWHWPCTHRRRYQCEGLGMVNAYATRGLSGQLLLVTTGENYGLSPADPAGFVQALQKCHALGVARPLQPELARPPLWTWRLWRDYRALFLIGIGLLAVLLMFGLFCFRLPVISSDVPLHFDINGLPDRIAPKIGLIALPAIGLLAWLVNLVAGIWIYRTVQRQGAYLLWGGAVVVQVIAGLALLNAMRW
jgi:hypothetical protein